MGAFAHGELTPRLRQVLCAADRGAARAGHGPPAHTSTPSPTRTPLVVSGRAAVRRAAAGACDARPGWYFRPGANPAGLRLCIGGWTVGLLLRPGARTHGRRRPLPAESSPPQSAEPGGWRAGRCASAAVPWLRSVL